jgi:hypothetical protein
MAPRKALRGKRIKLWALKMFAVTLILSAGFSVAAEFIIANLPIYAAVIILVVLICIGILADIIAIAVTAADDAPFFSMASKKIRGAQQGILLLQHAEEVSNFCGDVIGDVSSIVSGAAGAAIVAKTIIDSDSPEKIWVSIAVSAILAALMVSGKALGKAFAIKKSKETVLFLGRMLQIMGFKGS